MFDPDMDEIKPDSFDPVVFSVKHTAGIIMVIKRIHITRCINEKKEMLVFWFIFPSIIIY